MKKSVWVILAMILVAGCSKGEQAQTGQQQAQDVAQASQPATREVAPAAEAPHWSYEGESGPSNWATLSAEWTPCGEGKSQSPIDIHETTRAELPAMQASFKPAALTIVHHTHMADAVNNGHTIQVNYSDGDVLAIGEEKFGLLQYHFHSPSEHTVHGKHYPMEMHLVHKSAQGTLAVVGVFIEEGAHNSAFDPIWSNLPATKGVENHFADVMVDVSSLLPASTESYRYDGSLTTPPCSEGVKWIVMATPIQLDAQQIAAFRAIVSGNNRPVQPLNGRPVVTDHVVEAVNN